MIRQTTALLALLALAATPLAQTSTWTQVGPSGVFTFRTSPDYAADGRVWIATGPQSFAGDGVIHLSTDHGDTFGFLSTLPGAAPETTALAVSPTHTQDSTLVATSNQDLATASTLWKSTDSGATWNAMPQPSALAWGNNFKVVTLAPDYASMPTILAACLGFGCHNQVSNDGGSSWDLVPFPQGLRDLEFASDFATSGLAYGVRKVSSTFFTSDDFGQSFSQCSQPLGSTELCAALEACWGIAVAPVGPQGERTICFFGKPGPSSPPNFLRSDDGGSSWDVAGAGLGGLEVYDVALSPDFQRSGRLYAATSDGVWFSDDAGTSFAPLEGGGLPSPVVRLELAGGVDGDLYALAGGTPDPQIHGVAPGGLADPHDVYRLRLAGTGVLDLGNALAGSGGTPSLAASTEFGSSAVTLELTQAPPSATATHVFGFAGLFAPLFGSVLVPSPDIQVNVATTATGTAELTAEWPAIVPPGFELFVQTWIANPSAPPKFAASNGLKLTRL